MLIGLNGVILGWDPHHHGPGPLQAGKVNGYLGTVQVFEVTADGTSFVLWTSSWESSEGGVADSCNPMYQALLGDMKASLES